MFEGGFVFVNIGVVELSRLRLESEMLDTRKTPGRSISLCAPDIYALIMTRII
jgi:hypothetical protein